MKRLLLIIAIALVCAAPCQGQMPAIPVDTFNNPVADFQRDVSVLKAEQSLLQSQMQPVTSLPTPASVAQQNELKRQFWQYAAGSTAAQGGAPHAVASYAANHYGLMTGRITPAEYQAERARILAATVPAGSQQAIQTALGSAQAALDAGAQTRLAQLSTAGQGQLSAWQQFTPAAWQELVLLARKVSGARTSLAQNPSHAENALDDSIVWRTQLQDKVTGPYQSLVASTGYRNPSLETAIADLNVQINALQAAARRGRSAAPRT